MSIILGLNAVTAINSGSTAVPVWEILTNIRDEAVNMETALADVTNRASNGWRLQVPTLSTGSVDSQMIYDTDNSDFNTVHTAFLNRTRLLMGFFDGDPETAGTEGLMGGFGVTNFTNNRNLEEAIMVDVTFTARENDVGDGPEWVVMV